MQQVERRNLILPRLALRTGRDGRKSARRVALTYDCPWNKSRRLAAAGIALLAPSLGMPLLAAACPTYGNAHSASLRRLNTLKNRRVAPSKIRANITLRAMLKPGQDWNRWNASAGASLVGYVVAIHAGGIETANCKHRDVSDRDTHIELAMTPDAPQNQHLIVEVTPWWRDYMRLRGVDWSTSALNHALLHKQIKVTGWLLFDFEHANASRNTAPTNSHDWRATAWEIHPVTAIILEPLSDDLP